MPLFCCPFFDASQEVSTMQHTKYPQFEADQLLKPEDIARWMNVSRRTVMRWVKRGQLDAYQIGNVTRIRPADFLHFLERHDTGERRSRTR
jgi:excisionase family DNA binding protein